MRLSDLDNPNLEHLERLYEQYQRDPESLESEWATFFKGFELGYRRSEQETPPTAPADGSPKGVYALIHAYRELGHLIACLDPLGQGAQSHPLLELSEFGLSEEDMDRRVGRGDFLAATDGTLRDLLAKLRTTYCQTLGMEYTSIPDKAQRDWLQQRVEPVLNRPGCSEEQCRKVLGRLLEAEEFERFLHTRYVGQKRFSLEGGEALLPLLDVLVETGSDLEVEEVVIGMAHRGRLNVLVHLLRKPYEIVLSEFEGAARSEQTAEGDVKYHMGYSYDYITSQGRRVHLSLSANPSHLELVDPVIEGIVHAKQDYLHDQERARVVPVLIHGEAAFTGQGIVAETLNLSQLEGYQTGGTIHLIFNNQLGYTAVPAETRFTPYPTDLAREVQAPVFHVNADDPEAVVQAARLAIEFRQAFKRDVLIDLWCYRRHGHNEADDPTLTQPLMYRQIAGMPTVCQRYVETLVGQGRIAPEEVEEMRQQVREKLDEAQGIARRLRVKPLPSTFGGVWQGLTWAGDDWSAHTAVNLRVLRRVGAGATQVPAGFSLHRTLQRLMAARAEMVEGKRPLDWGGAEMLAFGTLLVEGFPVRLAGQDSQRGTFSHRHAVWHDVETGQEYVPLAHLDRNQAQFTVLNTMLSELAVLGFEYGMSSANPRMLILWEAQFGDFVNGAQPIIDQFISSSESKWQRMIGLVLLLPHGYEGMGPEHTSARLERFLQLCGRHNMQVCYPTTPAQQFHVLRRQMHRNFRKPLILMTPKSLLRHKLCVSDLGELAEGSFHLVIDDAAIADPEVVRRVVLCAGKVYFDLAAAREEAGETGAVALVRVEQLYPFPHAEIRAVLARYPRAAELYWVQEEPRNMGAWHFVRPLLDQVLPEGWDLGYVGRDEAASPATGSYQVHQDEQQFLVEQALGRRDEDVVPSEIRRPRPIGAQQVSGQGG